MVSISPSPPLPYPPPTTTHFNLAEEPGGVAYCLCLPNAKRECIKGELCSINVALRRSSAEPGCSQAWGASPETREGGKMR